MDMEEERYYELTGETKKFYNRVVHRIRCTKDFRDYKAGDVGGWVEDYKNLSEQAWVEDEAVVCEYAKVKGSAIIKEAAVVFGFAKVCGTATISGNAYVGNHAFVMDAEVSGNACVCDYAEVKGNCVVTDHAWVTDEAKVYNGAIVSQHARVSGMACVSNNASITERATVGDSASVRGWVSICGSAAIYDFAVIRQRNPKTLGISGWTKIGGDAVIESNYDYIVFKNWWSSGRYFTWTRSNDMWRVGCFYGTGKELIAKAYKDSKVSGREYERVVKYVEQIKRDSKPSLWQRVKKMLKCNDNKTEL